MGLASDGGLMVPDAVPDVSVKLQNWSSLTYPELAFEVIRVFSDDINEDVLKRMTEESYAGFGHADVAPLRGVGSLHVLELFHGPTLAFKDFALQFWVSCSLIDCWREDKP